MPLSGYCYFLIVFHSENLFFYFIQTQIFSILDRWISNIIWQLKMVQSLCSGNDNRYRVAVMQIWLIFEDRGNLRRKKNKIYERVMGFVIYA